MFHEFDARTYLVSAHEMAFFEGDEEFAADQINQMLFFIADFSDEDDTLVCLEEVVRRMLFTWMENDDLLALDSDDMATYVEDVLAEVRQQDDFTDD